MLQESIAYRDGFESNSSSTHALKISQADMLALFAMLAEPREESCGRFVHVFGMQTTCNLKLHFLNIR